MDYDLSQFYGLESEDITRWLAKLETFLTLIHIDRDNGAASALRGLHLAGIAETWYYTLPEAERTDFWRLKGALLAKFSLSDIWKV